MKLQYLTQVQTLLDEYDFQDKYKVMLELEEYLSKLEAMGSLSREQVLNTLGTPADFVADVIGTYDLSKLSPEQIAAATTVNSDTEDLLAVNEKETEQSAEDGEEFEDTLDINPANDTAETVDNDNHDNDRDENESTTNDSKQNQATTNDSEQNQATNTASDKTTTKAKKNRGAGYKGVKLFFGILTAIFFFLAFLGLAFSLVVAIGLFFIIDMQTALSLFVGVLLMIIAIGLSISLIKNILLSIISRELKTVRIILSFLFIVLFAFLSKIMLNSTLDTISLYVTTNLGTVQNAFYSYNIDISNIDWNNLDLGESMKLVFDIVKSVL